MKPSPNHLLLLLILFSLSFSGCATQKGTYQYQFKNYKKYETTFWIGPKNTVGYVIPVIPNHRIKYTFTSKHPFQINIGTRKTFILDATGTRFTGEIDFPKHSKDSDLKFSMTKISRSTDVAVTVEDYETDKPYFEKTAK